jgi:ribosomal protein L33
MKFSQWCNKVTVFRGVRLCSLAYGYMGLEGCVGDYECACLPNYQTTQCQHAGVRKLITLHCNRFAVKYLCNKVLFPNSEGRNYGVLLGAPKFSGH